MPGKDFVHLHVHTEYSMLDGAAKIGDLFQEAERLGQPAMATTDHGYLFGAYEFWTKGKAAGIKPIIGLEAYLTPGTARGDRSRVRWGDRGQESDDVSAGGAYTHATMWARDTAGMHNLFRLASYASLEGHFYKARMDRDLLQRFSKGIIATTGCPSGEVQTRLRLGQYEEALKAAAEFQDIFGKDSYYVELMDHGLDIEKRVFEDLLRISKAIGAPLVATNDLHYTKREDSHAHEALLCVQSGSTLNEPTYDNGGKRFAFSGDGYYVKSSQEMWDLWGEYPEALTNTVAIAEQCEVEFNTRADYMPVFDCPPGEDEHSWFVKEVQKGLHERFGEEIPGHVQERANYEIEVIAGKGYPGYFLVVADFIQWSKNNGIRVGPGRGSGAGSMAAYAMKITDIDPIEHQLYFERFLNPERESKPDFDVDFDERRRGEVIQYVTDKYGQDRVSMIVTYGTIKAKQALKDSTRVLGKPFSLGEQLTKAYPEAIMGKDMPLVGVHDATHPRHHEGQDFRAVLEADPDAQQVFELAQGLEGLKRQWGVHAAGVIMSSDPLIDIIPIMRREQDGAVITQFDYPTCETLGLVKMDFLGLRNLTILDDALENIVDNGKEPLVLEDLPLADEGAFELLGRGDTLGVFQLDGTAMRQLLRQMKPDTFEDISAVLALYRPGPMGMNSHTNYAERKNGRQAIAPIHPELDEPLREVLGITYGLIVYQEQVQRIAQIVAGYTLGAADLLRRAMGKKKKEILDKEFEPFSAGMKANGYSDAAIKALWDTLLPFADYAFNKAHTAAYGVLSFWTAYLKAHYPTEFMAALLTSVGTDKDKSALYLAECRRMGITVLPPDVNESKATFSAVGTDIRFGLTAVRNVGSNVVAEIVRTRQEKGAFTSFADFLDKVPATVCNKRTIDSLIKAGGFDSLGYSRRALNAVHEQAIDSVIGVKRQEATGQFDLFADAEDIGGGVTVEVPTLEEWDKKTKLNLERDMLGLYVSDHPLSGLDHIIRSEASHQILNATPTNGVQEGSQIVLAGLVTRVDRRIAKSGNPYAIVTLEDMTGETEVSFFAKTYETFARDLAEDSVLAMKVRCRERGDGGLQFSAVDVRIPNLNQQDTSPVAITVPAARVTPPLVEQVKGILRAHPGTIEVRMVLTGPDRPLTMRLGDEFRVSRSSALYGDLKAALGPSCLAGV
ncbi:DNA polymerase III subunit alpha [Demequina lignilytica]|uniref:DNA polymerase III subunit alpha n=1 Tax=Demequina lignilytica TaxID=3051663 RepID=A0AAW7LZW7_9MICO|nr:MULTISPECIES: DNA polymerase III subunit alpha [unclassified Demequina]MDN4477100.1 DNA polymerase III subunit alpha [Demequina sp. SYSU T00039-1]MDN4483948.1 DNA polymerase III subunit alpha [Demequina sp. SYSU T0a273]MDN4487273.1 DNA polymerase III subunit alpha [Demequina sp. SYSU T00039]MDN4491524.1 DNA polymerase III subunit alpha [Demequina sp. SYSU T00068]